jgi:undecaprenyl-diphosphatase
MIWFTAIILGLIQGLTEFIPISSSGHLVIAQTFLSGASDHLLLEFINIGTMLALFVYFRKRIWKILTDIVQNKNFRLARNIIITSVPAGIVGYLLSDFISSAAFFGSAWTVAVTLALVGIVMIIVEKLPHASGVKDGEALSAPRALVVGLAQMLALIPGVSRSGSTILAGRFAGLKPAEAAEYSFLASLPIMVGVTLKVLVSDSDYLIANAGVLAVSNLVAFASGLFAVGFLMRYLAKHSLAVFGWYRVALSLILVIILVTVNA